MNENKQTADVGAEDATLGLMIELPRTGGRYVYMSPLDIGPIEEGGTVGGQRQSRVHIKSPGGMYPIDVLGGARDVAIRVHEARKKAADSFAYALLSDEGKTTMEKRILKMVERKIEKTLDKGVKDRVDRLLPEAVGLELSKVAAEPETEPEPVGA